MRLYMFTIESASASLRFTNSFFLLPRLCICKNYLVLLLMNQAISWWAFANIIRIATQCHVFLPFQNPWAALIAVFNVLLKPSGLAQKPISSAHPFQVGRYLRPGPASKLAPWSTRSRKMLPWERSEKTHGGHVWKLVMQWYRRKYSLW